MVELIDAAERWLPAIAALERQCFSDPWSVEMLRSELPDDSHEFLLAVEGEELLGYVGLMTVLDEGYLSNVAVSPAYRRQGIAEALLTALLARARARKLSFVTLEVRAGNTPAQALYRKLGFQEVGVRRAYYEHPKEDAVLMTLFL
jgi:ribosomal-protein-alanine N-acetyltransferase